MWLTAPHFQQSILIKLSSNFCFGVVVTDLQNLIFPLRKSSTKVSIDKVFRSFNEMKISDSTSSNRNKGRSILSFFSFAGSFSNNQHPVMESLMYFAWRSNVLFSDCFVI